MTENLKILEDVEKYYSGKIREHGATPAGVDWNSQESQELRFEQLLNVIAPGNGFFSLLDYGCGFGSMYSFMKKKYSDFAFTGFDISNEMIKAAGQLFPPDEKINWQTSLVPADRLDYAIASGIFNVKQEATEENWLAYIIDTLHQLQDHSIKGFSFNVLTKYSDKEFMKDYLYYADPLFLFDYCKKNFSKQVALLHDYPLYEFTILVKK